jgi:hypothetical protein
MVDESDETAATSNTKGRSRGMAASDSIDDED